LSNMYVPLLLYADDLVLLATSPEDLQCLLDALSHFCESQGMSVNLKKTNVVVFRGKRQRLLSSLKWWYRGQEVRVVDSYTYLGVAMHAQKPMTWTADQQVPKAHRALAAMTAMFAQTMADKNVWLHLSLFKVLVMPALTYGCQVWGTCLLSFGLMHMSDELNRFRLMFFRRLLGVRKSTAALILHRELGQYSLQFYVASQMIEFWNKAISIMPPNSLVHIAAAESYAMRLPGSWTHGLFTFLEDMGALKFLSEQSVLLDLEYSQRAMRNAYTSRFLALPPPEIALPSLRTLSVYHHWFASALPDLSCDWAIHPYLRRCQPFHLISKLARFRLGSHYLHVQTGAWQVIGDQIPLHMRFCTRCHHEVLDDELHAIFQCPVYASLRHKYTDIFSESLSLRALFSTESLMPTLSKFLLEAAIC
jgi:Reverse transcriptase (RNA-dependent DNA polymerase)